MSEGTERGHTTGLKLLGVRVSILIASRNALKLAVVEKRAIRSIFRHRLRRPIVIMGCPGLMPSAIAISVLGRMRFFHFDHLTSCG